MNRSKQLSRNPSITLRSQMNIIWLDKPRRPSGSHESIGLDHPDSPFAKFLLNAGDVGLAHVWGIVSPKIVAPKLQNDDFGALWNGARQSSQHAARCISVYACVRDSQAGPPGLQHCL
jgi:hypothetical protein